MSLSYKIDVLAALKEAGYNTNRLRKEKLLAEGVIQSLREYNPISWGNIAKVCKLLNCQPGDILEYTDDSDLQADNSRKSDSLNQQAAADPAGPLS